MYDKRIQSEDIEDEKVSKLWDIVQKDWTNDVYKLIEKIYGEKYKLININTLNNFLKEGALFL